MDKRTASCSAPAKKQRSTKLSDPKRIGFNQRSAYASPPAKKQRSTKLSDPKRIGFFFISSGLNSIEFLIFALNSGDGGDDYPKIEPVLRIRGFGEDSLSSAMCICNSTLYIFEGRTRHFCVIGTDPWVGRSVWKLDISSYLQKGAHPKTLDIRLLTPVRDMLSKKTCPVPVPISTSAGLKIIVLSEVIANGFKEEGLFSTDIELYDTSNDSLENLPRIPFTMPEAARPICDLISCSLLGESRIMINTKCEAFVMDLDSAYRQWQRATPIELYVDFLYLTIKNRYVLSPGYILDVGQQNGDKDRMMCDFGEGEVEVVVSAQRGGRSTTYQLSAWDDEASDDGDFFPPPAIFLGGEDEANSVCTTWVSRVQSVVEEGDRERDFEKEVEYEDYTFRAIIDVCCTDLDELENNVVQTLRFSFDAYPYFQNHGFFVI